MEPPKEDGRVTSAVTLTVTFPRAARNYDFDLQVPQNYLLTP